MVAGLEKPDGGRIILEGIDVAQTPPWNRNLGMVFQQYAIFPHMTVAQNVAYGLKARKKRGHQLDSKITEMLKLVGLSKMENKNATLLSGGEQQMLAVGRAYMSGRKVMLLDEPSMGLAPLLMMSMFNALKEINSEGTTILLVEQNASLALQFAQRGYVLENGNMVLSGNSADLLDDEEVYSSIIGGEKWSGDGAFIWFADVWAGDREAYLDSLVIADTLEEIEQLMSVEPGGKLPTTWAVPGIRRCARQT